MTNLIQKSIKKCKLFHKTPIEKLLLLVYDNVYSKKTGGAVHGPHYPADPTN